MIELIGSGETWSYFKGTGASSPFPDLAWASAEFDEAAWNGGQGGFGYGPDADTRGVSTVLEDMKDNYSSVFLRHHFSVPDHATLTDLVLTIDVDDAFIAYINGVEVARSGGIVRGRAQRRMGSGPGNVLIDISSLPDLLQLGNQNVLAIEGINRRASDDDFILSQIQLVGLSAVALPVLQAGDGDQDMDFDQLDLVQVQVAAKYLTGQPASWGQGDWDGAPGGSPGNPPAGDAIFNQLDIVAAQQAGTYLTGPYAAVRPNGQAGDGQTSVVYNPETGELAVDAPAGTQLTSINIDSAAGIFHREPGTEPRRQLRQRCRQQHLQGHLRQQLWLTDLRQRGSGRFIRRVRGG